MENSIDTDHALIEQIFNRAIAPGDVQDIHLFSRNRKAGHFECVLCSHSKGAMENGNAGCFISATHSSPGLSTQLIDEIRSRYLRNGSPDVENMANVKVVVAGGESLIGLTQPAGELLGLLVLKSDGLEQLQKHTLETLKLFSQYVILGFQESQRGQEQQQMISRLKLLSDASNVLLSEFDNVPLEDKLDYVVKKSLEILDAELCSLWLANGKTIDLASSFSSKGKVEKNRISLRIQDGPKSGLTGSLACRKEVFNAYGEKLWKHPAMNRANTSAFVPSKEVYSELAYPMLDGNANFLGLLIAYNKKDESGQPTRDRGFSKEFDEPVMKILTTKIAISIKNSEPLKRLRGYELIVESTPDPVMIFSRAGKINYMNPEALKLFGDLKGRHVTRLYHSDHTGTGIEKAKEVKRLLFENEKRGLTNFETSFLSSSGATIPVSLSASVLFDEFGKEIGIAAIARDLREMKDLMSAGESLLNMHDIEQILDHIEETGLRIEKSIRAYIKVYDEATDTLVFRVSKSKGRNANLPTYSTPADSGITGWVFQTQHPLLCNDVFAEPRATYVQRFKDVRSKIIVPITYQDKETHEVRRLGIMSVDSDTAGAFSNKDLYFLTNLANQAAVALQNANLIASKNEYIRQLQAVDKVQQSTTGKALDIESIYDAVLDAVVDILGYEFATISAVNEKSKTIETIKGRNVPNEFYFYAKHSLDSKDIQAWVVRHKHHVYLDKWDDRLDKEIYERFEHHKLVRVFIPIIARGQALGTLEIGHYKTTKPKISEDEISTVQKLVNLAGVGIEQANLVQRLKDDIKLTNMLKTDLDALNLASLQILNSTTEREAINYIFKSLDKIGHTKGMLSLVDEESNELVGEYAFGDNWKRIPADQARYSLAGNNLLAQALRTGKPIHCKNCMKEPRWNKRLAREAKIKSQYIFPLIVKNNPIGTLQIDLSDSPPIADENLEQRMKVLETFASQCAIAIRNIRDMVTIDRLEDNIAETAHEFRSPLHNIMTQLGGLKHTLEQGQDGKNIDHFVSVIEEQIHRANRQVNNSLLAGDRIRDKMEFDFRDGFIQEVITGCVHSFKLRALKRGISIIVKDNVKALPQVQFDHAKMEQAITNLVDNAVKYSYYNQFIHISGFDDGTRINIEVTDRGVGIPKSEFGIIFKGLKRSEIKDHRRYIPGTGLGLKICLEIVKGHGGDISVNSVPLSRNQQRTKEYQDYKTTFKVSIPKSQKGEKRNDQYSVC